jgi:hypothetical protein
MESVNNEIRLRMPRTRSKKVIDNLLLNRHMQASDLVDEIIVELRMMKAAINSHIKEPT